MKKVCLVLLLACSTIAARAQIYLFHISLSGSQETPVNASPALGFGSGLLNASTDMVELSVYFNGLTAPATASHIHVGAPGVPGGVIVSFAAVTPNTTFGSIIGGPLAFPAANIPDFLAGNTYFNIHDANFPGGEIRGQLIPAPEPSALALIALGLGAMVWRRRF
jgi:hypothetical protein